MRWLLILAIVLVAVGITGLVVTAYFGFAPDGSQGFAGDGERIFFTGTSANDEITATGGPAWFRMHGGGCVACHGPDGRGRHITMMANFTAPDIRYKTLTKPHEGMPAFTDQTIKRAITQGKDSDGSDLSANMPRWRMSDRDLNDVIGYLKTLDP